MEKQGVVYIYRILGSTRERKFSMGSTGFFSKSTFPTNKTLMLKQYGLSSRKRRPPLSDHPGLTVWVVVYGRFNTQRGTPKESRKHSERISKETFQAGHTRPILLTCSLWPWPSRSPSSWIPPSFPLETTCFRFTPPLYSASLITTRYKIHNTKCRQYSKT